MLLREMVTIGVDDIAYYWVIFGSWPSVLSNSN